MTRSRATSGTGKKDKKELSIAVLGSGGVGKSCLTAQFVQHRFIESYDPTIEDSYMKNIEVAGEPVSVEVQDTAGTEQFTSMRDRYISSNDVYLLVFSLTSPSSLDELEPLYHQILALYEKRIRPAVERGGAIPPPQPAVPFKQVDYNAERTKARRRNGGPNPLTSPNPLTDSFPSQQDGAAAPGSTHTGSVSLPALPLLILANKADLPATQHIFSKSDIAARINRWHTRYQAQSVLKLPIPAPKVVTTSARSRFNVDESFVGVSELGIRLNQWVQDSMPAQPAVPSRNPFSRSNSSNAIALSDGTGSRLASRMGLSRSRGNTRTSQSTNGSGENGQPTTGYVAGMSPPQTASGAYGGGMSPLKSEMGDQPPHTPSRRRMMFSRQRGHKVRAEIPAGGADSKNGGCVVM